MAPFQPSQPDAGSAPGPQRVAVLHTAWYPDIIEGLMAGAKQTLHEGGVAEDQVVWVEVPGAYELPQAAMWVARQGDVDAIVALSCVVRGETPHFDFIAQATSDGLLRVALDTGVPVGLGVITANTLAQAQARSASGTAGDAGDEKKGGNKGIEAADAVLRMMALYGTLEARRRSR